MTEFHAIIVDKSLMSLEVLKDLKLLSQDVPSGNWTLYKISVNENDLISTIKKIQPLIDEGGWYFHFYNSDGSRLVVAFKDKIFELTNNPTTWSEAIDYGVSLGVPLEQLDFAPTRFEDEEF